MRRAIKFISSAAWPNSNYFIGLMTSLKNCFLSKAFLTARGGALSLAFLLNVAVPSPRGMAADSCVPTTLPGSAADCENRKNCILEKFKNINAQSEKSNLNEICKLNQKSGVDNALVNIREQDQGDENSPPVLDAIDQKLPPPSKMGVSFCVRSYQNLSESIKTFGEAVQTGCLKAFADRQKCLPSGGDENGKDAQACLSKVSSDAAKTETDAATILQKAIVDAKKTKKLSVIALTRYERAKQVLEKAPVTVDPSCHDEFTCDGRARTLEQTHSLSLMPDSTVLLGDSGDNVTQASDGGADNLFDYELKIRTLKKEQTGVIKTSTDFIGLAQSEVQNRTAAAQQLQAMALTATSNDKNLSSPGTKPSDITGTKPGTNIDSLTSLTNAATQASKAAGALSNSSGASQPSSINSTGGSTYPSLPSSTGASSAGGSGASTVGSGLSNSGVGGGSNSSTNSHNLAPTPGAPTGAITKSVSAPSSGSAGSGSSLGQTGSGPEPRSSPSGRSLASAGGASSGGDSSFSGQDSPLKESAFNGQSASSSSAPCVAGDKNCAAKAADGSASAFGSLGTPLLGAPEPTMETAGALEALLGIQEGIMGPGDGKKNGTSAMGALLNSFTSVVGGEEANRAAAQDGANLSGTASSNSHSLFARVHLVHERAQRKGYLENLHKSL